VSPVDDDTIAELAPTVAPTERDAVGADEAPLSTTLPGYDLGARLGMGGMGEVVVGFDRSIGREIAIKRIRQGVGSSQAVERFLREARIQARLEHPAIVPVYALGHDRGGNPYFTMKRLDGTTLQDQLRTPTARSLHELLRTVIDACRAIQLAHARGVVHRDIKPANIMVGSFGEVYVLDWGIARIVDDREVVARGGDVSTLDGMTEAGAMVGTPGYMAPEQVLGATDVGPPADVYAIGAILYEVLAGVPLHPPGRAALHTTVAGVTESPCQRAPDRPIPPELDALCLAALATEPTARPAIEQVADGIQRYLDGDRDHERRRELAAGELATARAALAAPDPDRATAIRAAGRALALDPKSHDAATLISSLMLQPPAQPPPSLAAVLAESDARVQRRQARAATLALCAVLVFLGAVALEGARDLVLLGGTAIYTATVAALAWSVSRRNVHRFEMWIVAAGNAMLAALLSRLFGPLIVTPIVISIMAVSLTSYPLLMHHSRIVIAMLVAAWLGPVALESAGVLAETWRVEDGRVVSMSSLIEIRGHTTAALLIGANVLAIVVIGMFANTLARARHAAQRDVEIQAWHLRHLLPDR